MTPNQKKILEVELALDGIVISSHSCTYATGGDHSHRKASCYYICPYWPIAMRPCKSHEYYFRDVEQWKRFEYDNNF